MNDLQVITKEGVVAKEFSNKLCKLMDLKKRIEAEEKEMEKALKNAMDEHNIYALKNDDLTISNLPEGTQETFDKDAFKEDYPELYDKYTKITTRSAQLKILRKEKKNG